MMITPLSFFMSVLWSGVIILIVHFLRRRKFFLRGFGVITVALLYTFCALRILFSLEFPFTTVIVLPELYNPIYQFVCLDTYNIAGYELHIFDFLLLLWGAISIVLLCWFYIGYYRNLSIIKKASTDATSSLYDVLSAIQAERSTSMNIRIMICPLICSPIGIGVFKKYILIPAVDYSDKQLDHILLHEYTHFKNHDFLIKFLVAIFCRIFCWNPFMLLLRSDTEQMIEIKCDLHATSSMDKMQRAEYLLTLKELYMSSVQKKSKPKFFATHLLRPKMPDEELIERFDIVAHSLKRRTYWYQIISIVMFFLLIVSSYLFVLQPHYEPPATEMVTNNNVSAAGDITGYILKQEDGSYTYINSDGSSWPMQSESVEVFISMGVELKEEN